MSKDLIKEAQDDFQRCQETEAENREDALFDLRFARNDEQWPEDVRRAREEDGRPCLTLNRLPPIIRQVTGDGRMNKPAIRVHPRDSGSDPRTAEIMNGLIRQIEQQSQADAAYDTALEHSVTMGFGFLRVNTKYASDDTFDQDIVIERVADPFTIYGDPESTAVDSSDWNIAFATERMTKASFQQRWKGADVVNWDDYRSCKAPWVDGDYVTLAEYWTRTKASKTILMLSTGEVVDEEVYVAQKAMFDAAGASVVGSREVDTHKVKMHLLTGAEVLDTREWGGKYIPIIPVYGEEIFIDGERKLRGIVRGAIQAQQNFNLWRSASTESVLNAPIAPWVGPKGAFDVDPAKWAEANRKPQAYLEYETTGANGETIQAPQRQLPTQIPAAALQEALNASDDIKAITGIHDASLGARSNETSGKAIMARQREGDISTFHYIDNLSRAIQHTGRIILDLIPTVYSAPRVLRVLGEDGKAAMVPVNQPVVMTQQGPVPVPQQPAPGVEGVTEIFDLTAGKYDLTVKVGPSFTSQREETANQIIELIRVFPQAAPVLGDILAQNMDWPQADEVSERMAALVPPQAQGQNPQLEQAKQMLAQAAQEVQQAKAEAEQAKNMNELKAAEVAIKKFEAETDRLKVESEIANNLSNSSATRQQTRQHSRLDQPGNSAQF